MQFLKLQAILIITIIIIIERVITDLKKKEKRKKKGNIETPAGQPLTPRGFPRRTVNQSITFSSVSPPPRHRIFIRTCSE